MGSSVTAWSRREGAPGGVGSPRGCSNPANRRRAHWPATALGWPAARGGSAQARSRKAAARRRGQGARAHARARLPPFMGRGRGAASPGAAATMRSGAY
jgi:hypothetical protein